jgi:hypothetical protein
MVFEIAEDGAIKVTVDGISGANHTNADSLVGAVAKLAGGQTSVKRRSDHRHDHVHNHEHIRIKK